MGSENAPALSDILLMLDIVNLYSESGSASCRYVKDTFNESPVKQARIPSYAVSEDLCSKLGLLLINDEKIGLTQLGAKIVKYDRDKLNDEFKEVFVQDAVFGSKIGESLRSYLLRFHVGKDGIWRCPKNKVYELVEFSEIMSILYEVGFLEKRHDTVEINPKYMHLVYGDQTKITQKQIDAHLQIQKTVGEIGEELALAFEIDRLTVEGCLVEASKVSRISSEFANAGYDIESFVKGKDGRMCRAYIEVKGSVGTAVDFYWSVNEIKKAKECKENYWIYFIPGIEIHSRHSSRDLIRIQDPYRAIFEDSTFKTEVEQYHVVKNNTHL